MSSLKDKKIIVGITGGIAAYKICELIRTLVKDGAEVCAVMTPSAKEFITETTIRTLTKNRVYIEQFNVKDWEPEHINLADSADLLIIAPASANTIGKIANGICDNLLTSVVTAFKKPIIIAPAMNCNMWENNFVQKNLTKLESAGYHFVMPQSGELACGYNGVGRLADIDKIIDKTRQILSINKFLSNKKIIITAGGTKEPLDPVRYVGNLSSGKMGTAIADAAYELGAEVLLISTFKADKPYKNISTPSAREMFEVVKENFPEYGSLIMVAAVADYRPKEIQSSKIKKENSDIMMLELVKNPDILLEISKIKRENQLLV